MKSFKDLDVKNGKVVLGLFALLFIVTALHTSAIVRLGFGEQESSNQSQSAQVLKSKAPEKKPLPVASNVFTDMSAFDILKDNPAWRMFRVGNDFMVKLPGESLPAIANFCSDLATALPAGVDVNKTGAFNADGKYQCNDGSGLCGDGTREGCRRSGCCGGCPNGIYPPGATDPSQLPNVVFIPDNVIRAIKNNVNQ